VKSGRVPARFAVIASPHTLLCGGTSPIRFVSFLRDRLDILFRLIFCSLAQGILKLRHSQRSGDDGNRFALSFSRVALFVNQHDIYDQTF
jgi:hypothetical protein